MEDRNESISYFVHEGEMARMERHVKRLFIMWIITFAALVLTNVGWIYYESQYQDVVTESYSAETDQGGNGEVTINGKGELQESQN